jgi:hypothetical protein
VHPLILFPAPTWEKLLMLKSQKLRQRSNMTGGFGGTNAIREGGSNDADEEKRMEV